MKNYKRGIAALFSMLILAVNASDALAQEKPALLVLGSAHFNASGQDNINFDIENVLSPQRQIEMAALVEQLAEFKPTHIAIEIPSKYQSGLDKRYLDYREGRYELSRNEADQIGLRLAAKLGLDAIYAVDWNDNPPGDIEKDYDWPSFANTHGLEDKLAAITDPVRASEFYIPLKDQSIITWMKQLNHPDQLAASHKLYFDIAMIGTGEEMPGANWVGTWYARNLKIFSRLVNLAKNPEDRVLIIYGQGHAYLLQQFAREAGAFRVIDVDSVLSD